MKRIIALIWILATVACPSGAAILQITFQGTAKSGGVPITGTRNMQFTYVDSSGVTIPGTSPMSYANVPFNNGLFAVQLPADSTIDWQHLSPYIQVSVEGQLLKSDQPITANIYAIVAQSVYDNAITTPKLVDGSVTNVKLADGSITSAKLDASVQGITVPSGMVAMFTTSCPTGWTRFSQLDGSLPMGSASAGSTGGSASLPSGHAVAFGSGQGSGSAWITYINGDPTLQNHPISILPPYVTMVFCQKS